MRVLSLVVMGCSSTATIPSRSTPSKQAEASALMSYNSSAVSQQPPRGDSTPTSGTVRDIQLKGKGSNTETVSKKVTAKKMADWNVTADKVLAVADVVEAAAEANQLPASLIFGVIWVESRFNPDAVSPVGARGLMQLMPKTAEYLAECMNWEGPVDSFDPVFNIAAGSYYVSRLIKQFNGDVDLALAAYNAGPTNIRRWMKNTGLPEVSIEYYTMVQTAQQYFPTASPAAVDDQVLPTDDDLDRLGLAILIAGLAKRDFGLERPDDANPFNDM